ncbi:alanine-zipper protein [Listeria monocytogenes]
MTIRAAAEITLTDINDAIVAGEAPLNPTTDLLWMDSSASPNVLRRWDGEKWVSQTLNIKEADPETSQKIDAASQDATDAKQKADNAKQSADQAQETANQANTAAQNALTSANGKNKNYYGIMEPVAPQEGDRWFKSVNGEEVQTFIYSSGNWTPIKLAPENLGTIYAEDGVIGSLDAGKIIAASLAVISANLGDVTAGSINFGNGTFKVDTEGNLTAKNANLTNGTFSTDYTIPVIGGNPPIYATGSMGVGSGGINATDTFTQGGKNYTRETALDGNGLSISIREGNNPASSIILDAVNSGLYFSSKASGISFAGSGTSNGTDIDTYGNIRAQSSARTWSVIDADRTNAFSVPMSSRHEQYGYILTPRHIKAGNMVLSKDHSISSLDGGMIYFNNTPGGTRVDIACKSVQQSSLLSMKENIRTINLEDALQAIIDTDVRQYNFKGESNTHTSFIIDDINDEKQYYADPHFLSATGDGRDDGNIVGYLMLAVKKLKQEIDALQAS